MTTNLFTNAIRLELGVRSLVSRALAPIGRPEDEQGEGVISLAIAVLIMAVIGAAMYLVFRGVADDAGTTVKDKVATIK